jgi:hypothetical protein
MKMSFEYHFSLCCPNGYTYGPGIIQLKVWNKRKVKITDWKIPSMPCIYYMHFPTCVYVNFMIYSIIKNLHGESQAWWLKPLILATWEAKIGMIKY